MSKSVTARVKNGQLITVNGRGVIELPENARVKMDIVEQPEYEQYILFLYCNDSRAIHSTISYKNTKRSITCLRNKLKVAKQNKWQYQLFGKSFCLGPMYQIDKP